MQIVVDSLLTHYERLGTGKQSIVLLHGWGDSGRTFDQLIQLLQSDYTLITLDLPGFGGTQRPQGVWGLAEYADFVRHVLDKLEVVPYALVGHSNGGAIAISGLSSGILSAKKLILIASAGVRTTAGQSWHRLAWGSVAKIGKVGTSLLPQTIQQRLRRRLYAMTGSDMMVTPGLEETFKKVVTSDIRADAAQVTVPSLLLYGETDMATPPHFGELLAAALPSSKLVIVPGAGHFVHQEQAQQVAAHIKEFLA